MLVELYTDGSGTSFGKPGGYAFVIVVDGANVYEGSGSEKNATNNTMELTAAVKGLEHIASDPVYVGADIVLISDSQLVLGFASGNWKCKKLHLALLAFTLNKVYVQLKATQRWVKGHNGNLYNERCDELAKAEREKYEEKARNREDK